MNLRSLLSSILSREVKSPQRPKQAESPSQPDRRQRRRVNPREGSRFLVIDDSQTVVVALRRMLDSVGYHTLTATNAENGLELAQKERPDLIFLDIVLPGMNGFSALRALRRDHRTQEIPVIMMSGDGNAIEQLYGTRINADIFMKKPFTRQDVFGHIERLLDTQRVPRRRRQVARPSL